MISVRETVSFAISVCVVRKEREKEPLKRRRESERTIEEAAPAGAYCLLHVASLGYFQSFPFLFERITVDIF